MDAEEHDSYNKKRPSQGPYSSNECGKKMKQQEEECGKSEQHDYSGFASLPTDVLISILCRSPASDHKALRDTCKAFRTTIDSAEYKGERATSGWAEVSTHLVSGEELYDRVNPNGPEDVSLSDGDVDEDATEEERANKLRWKIAEKQAEEMIDYGYSDVYGHSELGRIDQDYGHHDITMDVVVDGSQVGSLYLVILPRGVYHNYPFHDATDAHSSELQMVGWTLCDSAGRLKVRSIKNEELVSGEAGKGGYLHINTVRISDAYRPMGCTNVVSEAVRSALTQPKLEGEWTLATAISDYNVYITDEEMKLKRRISNGEEGNAEENERVEKRLWERAVLDTKTYLRVGFKQIPETVGSLMRNPYWLFALPHFLKNPIKSFEEVDQTPLIEPPDLPPKPVGVDSEILVAVKKAGNSMRRVLDSVRTERLQDQDHNCLGRLAELEGRFAGARNLIEGGKPDHLSDESWREMVADVESIEEMLRAQRAAFEEATRRQREEQRNEIDVTIPRKIDLLKNEVNALVQRGGSIRNSYAIHCSSRLRIPQYIDFLLEMVPLEKRAFAVSSLDDNGLTPLHCAVLGTPEVHNREDYLEMVERLLDFGADTNVKSAQGATPLGMYRSTMTDKFDYSNVFGIRSGDEPAGWRPFHRKMEDLLRPSQGETDADVEAKCAVLDNDMGSDIDLDNEDEDADEDDWMNDDEDDENDEDEE